MLNTLVIGRNLIRLASVDSTNNYTNELMRHSVLPEGTVVIADEQTGGKGRRGRHWYSEKGKNLTLSIVLKPVFLQSSSQFRLSQAIALGISDCLENLCNMEFSVKWPNDVILQHGKIAGILIESSMKGNKLQYVVTGMGININQTQFPETVRQAISLAQVCGNSFDLENCLHQLCLSVEIRYFQLQRDEKQIHSDYLRRLYKFMKWDEYLIEGVKTKARIANVQANGAIEMETAGGDKMICHINSLAYQGMRF